MWETETLIELNLSSFKSFYVTYTIELIYRESTFNKKCLFNFITTYIKSFTNSLNSDKIKIHNTASQNDIGLYEKSPRFIAVFIARIVYHYIRLIKMSVFDFLKFLFNVLFEFIDKTDVGVK